jgi:hypothetical protein
MKDLKELREARKVNFLKNVEDVCISPSCANNMLYNMQPSLEINY